jgi:hypothetical protein
MWANQRNWTTTQFENTLFAHFRKFPFGLKNTKGIKVDFHADKNTTGQSLPLKVSVFNSNPAAIPANLANPFLINDGKPLSSFQIYHLAMMPSF